MAIYNWSGDYCQGFEPGYPPAAAFNGQISTQTGQDSFVDYWFPDGNASGAFIVTSLSSIFDSAETVTIHYCAWNTSKNALENSGLQVNGVELRDQLLYAYADDESDLKQESITVDVTGTGLQTVFMYADSSYLAYVGISAIDVDGVRLIDGVEYPPPPPSPITGTDLFLVNRDNASYKVQGQNLSGLLNTDIILIDDNGVSKKVPKSKWGIIPDSAWVLLNRTNTSYKVSGTNFKSYLGL